VALSYYQQASAEGAGGLAGSSAPVGPSRGGLPGGSGGVESPRRRGSFPRVGTAGLGWPAGPLPERPHGVAPPGLGGLGWPGTHPDPSAGPGSSGVQVNGEEPGIETVKSAADGGRRGTNPVVIPEVPRDQADTPIGRAAEVAVGVRDLPGRQLWPRPPRCRVITIANQKGGVGKTTTAVNLAASLAQHGSRVLVMDLDPQGNASTALDVAHHSGVSSVYDVLVEERLLAEIVRPAGEMPGLFCAPATIDLAGAEIELVPMVARELRLAKALRAYDTSELDYIFVDCPPSLGLLTVNALVAAEEVLLPIQCEYYALEGVQQLLNTAELVRVNFNPGLHISTVLLTMYDGRTRLAADVAQDVRAHFGASVLRTIIPRSVRVSEAPSRGQSVITYDPGSSGAIAYTEAAQELAMQSARIRPGALSSTGRECGPSGPREWPVPWLWRGPK
jgi:chromosome partitioning protein